MVGAYFSLYPYYLYHRFSAVEATANAAEQVIRCECCALYTAHDQISYRMPETLMLLYQTDAVQLVEEQLGSMTECYAGAG